MKTTETNDLSQGAEKKSKSDTDSLKPLLEEILRSIRKSSSNQSSGVLFSSKSKGLSAYSHLKEVQNGEDRSLKSRVRSAIDKIIKINKIQKADLPIHQTFFKIALADDPEFDDVIPTYLIDEVILDIMTEF
jgi:hypothetical protein